MKPQENYLTRFPSAVVGAILMMGVLVPARAEDKNVNQRRQNHRRRRFVLPGMHVRRQHGHVGTFADGVIKGKMEFNRNGEPQFRDLEPKNIIYGEGEARQIRLSKVEEGKREYVDPGATQVGGVSRQRQHTAKENGGQL